MTLQLSIAVRNARLDVIETTIGASAVLKLRTGSPPSTCATADSGTVVATMDLPANWLADAASGSKSIAGLWEDLSADNPGTVGHFRIYDSGGTVCGIQGTVTITGGGGDMTLDNDVVAVSQSITITSFTLTDGNA